MDLTSSKPFIKPQWYPTVEIENWLLMDHWWSLLIPCLPPLLFRQRSIRCVATTGLLAPPSAYLRHRRSACTTAGLLASPPSWPRVFWGSDLQTERWMCSGGEVETWLVAADRKAVMASDGCCAGRWGHKGATEVKCWSRRRARRWRWWQWQRQRDGRCAGRWRWRRTTVDVRLRWWWRKDEAWMEAVACCRWEQTHPVCI